MLSSPLFKQMLHTGNYHRIQYTATCRSAWSRGVCLLRRGGTPEAEWQQDTDVSEGAESVAWHGLEDDGGFKGDAHSNRTPR